jgi:hypothetical protein
LNDSIEKRDTGGRFAAMVPDDEHVGVKVIYAAVEQDAFDGLLLLAQCLGLRDYRLRHRP